VQYQVSLLPPVADEDVRPAQVIAALRATRPAYGALRVELDGTRVWVQPTRGGSEHTAMSFARDLREARLTGIQSIVVLPAVR
jgi:hypothetical protein